MLRYPEQLVHSAKVCRAKGLTYSEIQKKLNRKIPKGTLSSWFQDVRLPASYPHRVRRLNLEVLASARQKAAHVNRQRRQSYLEDVRKNNRYLLEVLRREDVSKLFLAALYLGEGAKRNKGFLTFANSDPGIMALFLKLLRAIYSVDESKFRCTVLCRADHDSNGLNAFWSKVTRIPLKQFYKARVDSRTHGKTSKNKNYKGVCRLDFFSSRVYDELQIIGDLAIQGP